MAENIFVDGLLVKPPRDNAPDFIKCTISIKRQELIAWLSRQQGEWVNVDVKESRGGKWYAAVNEYKPQGQQDSHNAAKSNGYAPHNTDDDYADIHFDEDLPF